MGKAARRNDPCPCGSGKKYKKCCLRQEKEARAEKASSQRNRMPTPEEVDRVGDRAVEAMGVIDSICEEVAYELWRKGSDPYHWLADVVELEKSVWGDGGDLAQVLTCFSSSPTNPAKRRLVEEVRSRLTGMPKGIYEALTTRPLQFWCPHEDDFGYWVHPLYGPDESTKIRVDLILEPTSRDGQSDGLLGHILRLDGLYVLVALYSVPLDVRNDLCERARHHQSEDQQSFEAGMAAFAFDVLVESRREELKRRQTRRRRAVSSNAIVVREFYNEFGRAGRDVLVQLARLAVGEGVDAVEAYGQDIYDRVMGRFSFQGNEDVVPAQALIETLVPIEELRACLEGLGRLPVALLLIPRETLAEHGLSPRDPIAGALRKAAHTRLGPELEERWEKLQLEHAWLSVATFEADDHLKAKFRNTGFFYDWNQFVQGEFWDTRLVDLPIDNGSRARFLRRVGEFLEQPPEELTLRDLPEDDMSIADFPGIGGVTFGAWRSAILTWFTQWRWRRAGIVPESFTPRPQTEEARRSLTEGIDDLAELFQ